MRDEDAILRQLQEQPDDLATLLVYADWLDDQGDEPRASFLRLQSQLLAMRARQRGLIGQSRRLVKIGKTLPVEWLAIVSRPRLVGTCWAEDDPDGHGYIFRYLPKGKLNYTSPSGTFQNATWTQIGNVVLMEMNRHYANYEGFIAEGHIRGSAHNVTGCKWRWVVERTTDPVKCDLGEPVRTVFDSHRRRARRVRRRPPR